MRWWVVRHEYSERESLLSSHHARAHLMYKSTNPHGHYATQTYQNLSTYILIYCSVSLLLYYGEQMLLNVSIVPVFWRSGDVRAGAPCEKNPVSKLVVSCTCKLVCSNWHYQHTQHFLHQFSTPFELNLQWRCLGHTQNRECDRFLDKMIISLMTLMEHKSALKTFFPD